MQVPALRRRLNQYGVGVTIGTETKQIDLGKWLRVRLPAVYLFLAFIFIHNLIPPYWRHYLIGWSTPQLVENGGPALPS